MPIEDLLSGVFRWVSEIIGALFKALIVHACFFVGRWTVFGLMFGKVDLDENLLWEQLLAILAGVTIMAALFVSILILLE